MDDRFTYQTRVIGGYNEAAPHLIPTYESLRPEQVLAPVAEFLPKRGARVLDIGAGPGTLAAWLARRGCHVAAVEPVSRFRIHGRAKYHDLDIDWFETSLPRLSTPRSLGKRYDAALAIGVLHHLKPDDQQASLVTLSNCLNVSGRLILSLRHGPCRPDRPGFPVCPDRISAAAASVGLLTAHRLSRLSLQPGNRSAGVTWTWLVFDKA